MINLFSVPHTGTHFLKGVLEDAGLEVRARHIEGWQLTNDLVVAPIRDPYTTYVSWVSRGRDQSFKEKWELFNKAFETQRMIIVPIDTEDRETYLKELSGELGVSLKTDWKPKNQGLRQDVGAVNLNDIYGLPVVKKFYDGQ